MEEPQRTQRPSSLFQRILDVCDYIGEKIANCLGITGSRFQYAVDEYNRSERRKKTQIEVERQAREKMDEAFTNLEDQPLEHRTLAVAVTQPPESEAA